MDSPKERVSVHDRPHLGCGCPAALVFHYSSYILSRTSVALNVIRNRSPFGESASAKEPPHHPMVSTRVVGHSQSTGLSEHRAWIVGHLFFQGPCICQSNCVPGDPANLLEVPGGEHASSAQRPLLHSFGKIQSQGGQSGSTPHRCPFFESRRLQAYNSLKQAAID